MNTSSSKQAPFNPVSLPVPFSLNQVLLTKQEHIELTWQSRFWKTQFHKEKERRKEREDYWQSRYDLVCAREKALKEELKTKEAIICDLNQRVFGKKSEKKPKKPESGSDSLNHNNKTARPRGQQRGSKGHGRTKNKDLPIVEEIIPLSEGACPECGKEYQAFHKDEESTIIEIDVRPYKRRLIRKCAKKGCTCTSATKIITAPIAPKVLRRNPYGISIWEEVLLNKFLYAQPLNRILHALKSHGLTISSGSITGGLKELQTLFVPIYQAIYAQQMTENRFHGDETRWQVFQQIEGKENQRWYLWVTRSLSAVYYCMDPTRSAEVPLKHFSKLLLEKIILICDRYSAYKKLARLNPAVTLAFCWAHVRRDFLKISRTHPSLKNWGLDWVNKVGTLYHINKKRVANWDKKIPLAEQSSLFQKHHKALKKELSRINAQFNKLLEADTIARSKEKNTAKRLDDVQRDVLLSLQNHWEGLTVFLDYPDVSMDNNAAEQNIRNPVLGRNSYYGSGSQWSAELTAIMFSIIQTLLLWKLNPRTWLRMYLEGCAINNGQAPEDLNDFLPWNMSEARREQLSKPPIRNTS